MFPCLKITLNNVAAKTVVSLVLKYSDTESENLSSFIWLSVLDGWKADCSNRSIIIRNY